MRFLLFLILLGFATAQDAPPAPPPEKFMADYARLMLAQDREGLIRLYSPNGTLIIGDGVEDQATLEQTAALYRNVWVPPTAFAWRNLAYQRLSPEVVAVSGGFDWTSPELPQGGRFNYLAVLVLEEGAWRIRSELEFQRPGEAKLPLPDPASKAASAAAPCVFCEIIAGTRQQEGIVYRDEVCTAFLSIGARNPGHVLIVPNEHAETFMAIPAETMHHLTDVAQTIIAAIKRTDLKCEGIMLQMNSGKAAGQAVFHAHLHIIPRFAGDAPVPPAEGATGQGDAPPPPKRAGDPFPMSELAPVAAKIRAELERHSENR